MDSNKSQMLKKLTEMKKELNRKQRKLEKMKRFASVKAHIRQKLSEHGNSVTSTHRDELPGTRLLLSTVRSPPSNIRTPLRNARSSPSNIRSPPGNVRSPLNNIRSPLSNMKSLANNISTASDLVSSWSINHTTADGGAKCPLFKVIKQSQEMASHIEIHNHNKGNTCDVIKETNLGNKQVTDSTASVCFDHSCTQRADTVHNGAIGGTGEDHSVQNHSVKTVFDLSVHMSDITGSETTVHLSEQAQPFKFQSAFGKSSESLGTKRDIDLKVVPTQLSRITTVSSTAEQNSQTSPKQSAFIDCVSRAESEEAIVHGIPVKMISLNPSFCIRNKHTSSLNNHLENTLPSTSSFEHLMDQSSSKNILQTLSDKENYVRKQETITDSEFFHVIGLTQKNGEAPCHEIAENQTPNIEVSDRTFSQIGNVHDKIVGQSHKSQKMSDSALVGGRLSESTSVTDCRSWQDIAGSGLQDIAGSGLQDIAGRGLQDIAGSGLQDIAGSGLQDIAGSGLQDIAGSGLQDIAGRGLQDIAGSGLQDIAGSGLQDIAGSGLQDIAGSGLQDIAGSWLQDIAGSGLQDIAGSGLQDIAGSGLQDIAGSGLQDIAGSGLQDIAGRGLQDIAGRGLQDIAGRGLQDIAGTGLQDIAGSGLQDIAGRGLQDIAGSGLQDIAGSGLQDIAGTGLQDIAGRGLQDIAGRGLQDIAGSGLQDIAGSGLQDIAGSGLQDIAGSGLQHIVGRGLQGIAGSGQQNIIGSRLHYISGSDIEENCLSVGESENFECSQPVSVNSTHSFSEYTELDAIPYSQFELTEDFLSETHNSQEDMNTDRHSTRRKYGSLVKRRSSRISSYCFAHSISSSLSTNDLLPHSGSVSSDYDCAVLRLKSKQIKPAAEQRKAAAVLSVFQFLIDEAKKVHSFLEFKLPSVYDNLISSKLKYATLSNGVFTTHSYAENKDKTMSEKDSQAKNLICYQSLSLKKNIGLQASTVINRGTKAIEESTNIDERNMRDAFRAEAVVDPCTDAALLERKLCSASAEVQEINITLLNNEESSDKSVEKHSLGIDNRSDNLTEELADTSSHVLRTHPHHIGNLNNSVTSVRKKKMPIYKSHGRLFRRSFGKSVAKMLFAAKNMCSCTKPHGSANKTVGDGITTDSDICSTGTLTLPLKNRSHQCLPLQESHVPGETISVICTCLSDRAVLTKSLMPNTVCHTSTQLSTLCPSSQQWDNMPLQMIAPKSLWQSVKTEPGLNINTQFSGIDSEQAVRSGLEVASSKFNASSLHSPSTSMFAAASHPVFQNSPGLSLTSTPKTVTTYRTSCDNSQPDFDISFDGNETSKKVDTSLRGPAERTEDHKFKTPVPHMQAPLHVSVSEFISPSCQMFPDKSCLHSVEEDKELPNDISELPTDDTSVIRQSNNSQNHVSSPFVTSSNFLSPWKKLLKTTLSPVIVLEQNTPGNYQMTPVFSPFIKRSRSKPLSSGNRSQKKLKFSGCFQSCTQDAVVALLNGCAQTTDNEMKPYIVSVQATSLTVWTEDLNGWTAELDWKLASEIHIMKACLLPTNDSVIAIAASGWNNQSLFATLFLYDWNTGDTTRYNIPLLEQQSQLQSPSQIELCSVTASELGIAVSSDTHYIIGQVLFDDVLKSVKSLTVSEVQRGKLLSFVSVAGQESANVSLTVNQEITIWNLKLGSAVKRIHVQSPLPCLTRLVKATSHKGILLLDTIWRVDDGDCGGVIAVNTLTGYIQKIVTLSVPDNSWKRIESAQSEASFVSAISDKGSLSIWNRHSGALLGYTKSKTTTCASVVTEAKYFIVGDIHGCLHIYST